MYLKLKDESLLGDRIQSVDFGATDYSALECWSVQGASIIRMNTFTRVHPWSVQSFVGGRLAGGWPGPRPS